MRKILILALLLFGALSSFAQDKYTYTSYGEQMEASISANSVGLRELRISTIGTIGDNYGLVYICIPEDQWSGVKESLIKAKEKYINWRYHNKVEGALGTLTRLQFKGYVTWYANKWERLEITSMRGSMFKEYDQHVGRDVYSWYVDRVKSSADPYTIECPLIFESEDEIQSLIDLFDIE